MDSTPTQPELAHSEPSGTKQMLGIIGGSGPDAGVDVLQKAMEIHREHMGPKYKNDKDAIYTCLMQAPGVGGPHGSWDLDDVECEAYKTLFANITSTIKKLELVGASCFCLPCNTLHAMEPALREWIAREKVECEFISIVESTKQAILDDIAQRKVEDGVQELVIPEEAQFNHKNILGGEKKRVAILGSFLTTDVKGKSPYKKLIPDTAQDPMGRSFLSSADELEFVMMSEDTRQYLQHLINETKRQGPTPALQSEFFEFVKAEFFQGGATCPGTSGTSGTPPTGGTSGACANYSNNNCPTISVGGDHFPENFHSGISCSPSKTPTSSSPRESLVFSSTPRGGDVFQPETGVIGEWCSSASTVDGLPQLPTALNHEKVSQLSRLAICPVDKVRRCLGLEMMGLEMMGGVEVMGPMGPGSTLLSPGGSFHPGGKLFEHLSSQVCDNGSKLVSHVSLADVSTHCPESSSCDEDGWCGRSRQLGFGNNTGATTVDADDSSVVAGGSVAAGSVAVEAVERKDSSMSLNEVTLYPASRDTLEEYYATEVVGDDADHDIPEYTAGFRKWRSHAEAIAEMEQTAVKMHQLLSKNQPSNTTDTRTTNTNSSSSNSTSSEITSRSPREGPVAATLPPFRTQQHLNLPPLRLSTGLCSTLSATLSSTCPSTAQKQKSVTPPVLLADYVVLSCTELPLLMAEEDKKQLEALGVVIVDPNARLAESLLKFGNYI